MTDLLIYTLALGVFLSIGTFIFGYIIGRLRGEYTRDCEYIDPRKLEPTERPKQHFHEVGSEQKQKEALARNKKAPIQRAG